MIDLNDLQEILPVYIYPKGHTVSFEAIKELVGKTAGEFNVPIAFELDSILTGSVPSFVIEDCLVIFHPEHKDDYFKIVFRIRREDDTAYICKYRLRDSRKSNNGRGETKLEQNYYKALMAICEYIKC